MVILEQATKPLAALHHANRLLTFVILFHKLVAQALVIPLTVIVFEVFTDCCPQRLLRPRILPFTASRLRWSSLSMIRFLPSFSLST